MAERNLSDEKEHWFVPLIHRAWLIDRQNLCTTGSSWIRVCARNTCGLRAFGQALRGISRCVPSHLKRHLLSFSFFSFVSSCFMKFSAQSTWAISLLKRLGGFKDILHMEYPECTELRSCFFSWQRRVPAAWLQLCFSVFWTRIFILLLSGLSLTSIWKMHVYLCSGKASPGAHTRNASKAAETVWISALILTGKVEILVLMAEWCKIKLDIPFKLSWVFLFFCLHVTKLFLLNDFILIT